MNSGYFIFYYQKKNMNSNLTNGIIMAVVATFLSLILVCIHCYYLLNVDEIQNQVDSNVKVQDEVDADGLPRTEEAL